MKLKDFTVNYGQPDSDVVIVNAWDNRQMVVAFIPTIHLDDYFRRTHLTGPQANLVVDRNLEAFSRIIDTKYEHGEHRDYARFGSTLPRVDITLADIETSGEILSDSVLNMAEQSGWVGTDGRLSQI